MGVPDNYSFSLQDVVNTVVPATNSLSRSYTDSHAAWFDIRYLYYKNVLKSLWGFRNYDNTSLLSFTSVTIDLDGNLVVTVNHNFEPTYISKDNGVTWVEATYNGDTATHTFAAVGAGTYYIKAKDYKQTITWVNNPVVVFMFDDWWLPSKEEMECIGSQLYAYNVGGFAQFGEGNDSYWSSSQYDNNYAWNYEFVQRYSVHDSLKDSSLRFRPSRSFVTNSPTSYYLRSRGPANGWIYDIESIGGGNYQYFEAYEDDYFAGTVQGNWATSYGNLRTATGIGAGVSNTSLMNTYLTSYAASTCQNLVTWAIH